MSARGIPVRPVVARVLCYPARTVADAARVRRAGPRGRDSARHIYVLGRVSPAPEKGRVEILEETRRARRCARPIDELRSLEPLSLLGSNHRRRVRVFFRLSRQTAH